MKYVPRLFSLYLMEEDIKRRNDIGCAETENNIIQYLEVSLFKYYNNYDIGRERTTIKRSMRKIALWRIELMPITRGKCTTLTPIILRDYYISDDVNYLPYLRPMSSMTNEEYKEYDSKRKHICDEYNRYCYETIESIDWLNAHHFDYRTDDEGKTMIKKGLALKAPDGMYK